MMRDGLWHLMGRLFGFDGDDPQSVASIHVTARRMWLRSLPEGYMPTSVCCVELLQNVITGEWACVVYGPIKLFVVELDDYTCEHCGRTFKRNDVEEEMAAIEESINQWGHIDDMAIICDDCYQEFSKWAREHGLL
jgi:hypothetical protein